MMVMVDGVTHVRMARSVRGGEHKREREREQRGGRAPPKSRAACTHRRLSIPTPRWPTAGNLAPLPAHLSRRADTLTKLHSDDLEIAANCLSMVCIYNPLKCFFPI